MLTIGYLDGEYRAEIALAPGRREVKLYALTIIEDGDVFNMFEVEDRDSVSQFFTLDKAISKYNELANG